MKLIDLLNKIVNEKEIPKKVKWNYHIYIYDERYDDYYEETSALFQNEMSDGMLLKSLNDEIEIIEEDKEIEELVPTIECYRDSLHQFPYEKKYYDNAKMGDKLNELIREVNKIKNKV